MFAQRFDPTAVESKKRRLSGSDSGSESSSSDASSESESESSSSESSSSESESESSDESETEDMENEDDTDKMAVDSGNPVPGPTEQSKEPKEPKELELGDLVPKDEAMEVDEDYISKHKSVFNKFTQSITTPINDQSTPEPQVELQDIASMPQPALPRDQKLVANNNKTLDWLTEPIYATPEMQKPFDQFDLSETMTRNLQTMGFSNAFSVQISVLEMLLNDSKENKLKPDSNGDILVNASTGSGKTLAYLIPIIESIKDRVVPRVRAIILVPTKPLINQVKQTLLQLSKGTNLHIMNLKSDISIKDEGHKLQSNEPDIIVSTPGRLVEHITNESLSLKALRYLVIDEADRLLNQSFQNWCNILISKIETSRDTAMVWKSPIQKMIFSATLTTDAGKLALLKFYKPRLIIINEEKQLVNEMFTVPKTLNEFYLKFGTNKTSIKPLLLSKFLMRNEKLSNVLIFTKSNESSLRLTKLLNILFDKLNQKINVQFLNSINNSSAIRHKLLKQFQTNEVQVLIVTDLIARGIDIGSITDVINYDLPNSSREYIHRVGRTARANNLGNAYSMVFGKGEQKFFDKIMGEINRGKELELIEQELVEGNDTEVYKESLEVLQDLK